MSTTCPVTMARLTDGTRVRLDGGDEGVIRVHGEDVEFHPYDCFGDLRVSPEGPVFPSDLEILARNGRTA